MASHTTPGGALDGDVRLVCEHGVFLPRLQAAGASCGWTDRRRSQLASRLRLDRRRACHRGSRRNSRSPVCETRRVRSQGDEHHFGLAARERLEQRGRYGPQRRWWRRLCSVPAG